MPKEQNWCCKGSKGYSKCYIKSEIKRTYEQEVNLTMARIYYQKTLDSVCYSWIIESLDLNGISNKILSFIKKAMSNWKTHMRLRVEEKIIATEGIGIKFGI
jgi:hypothetical protein